jgi:hypothetical protein
MIRNLGNYCRKPFIYEQNVAGDVDGRPWPTCIADEVPSLRLRTVQHRLR